MKFNRELNLQKLINYEGDIQTILLSLEKFGWDYSESIVKVDVNNLKKVLQKFLDKKISAKDIEYWADSIEIRDDIEISSRASSIIHLLANPYLYKPINEILVKEILDGLKDEN